MSENHDALIVAAITVRQRAYAPYSGFKVGAALLGDDGTIYAGVNVENAAYGSTICAERAALLAGVSAGCTRFTRLVVATDVPADHLSPPCGACCQVLAEFNPNLPIVLANLTGDYQETSLDQLYTHPFSARQLEGLAMNSGNSRRSIIGPIISVAWYAIFLLVQSVNKTAANVLALMIVAGWMLYLTYTMWKKRSPLQEWLASMVALGGIAGAFICGSLVSNDFAASLVGLVAIAGLLYFFAARLMVSNGANWWYNLAGVIASVGMTITIIGLMLLKGIIEANYLIIVALVGVFCAIIAVDKGQKIDAATQKQIEGSSEALKAEPIREKVKRERL